MRILYFFVCSFFISPLLFAQSLQHPILWGPLRGHFSDTSQTLVFRVDTAARPKPKQQSLQAYLDQHYPGVPVLGVEVKALGRGYKHQVMYHLRLGKGHSIAQEADWSFLLGSCAFQFQFPVTWLGIKRKRRNKIFDAMRQHPAELMLWMGDNIYLIFGQWKSRRRIVREYVRTWNRKPIEQFLGAYPHYATWDDHDYGPNNTDGDYHRKGLSLDAFKTFWANPYYGSKGDDGVYHHFRQGDAEFFMLDSRYHCTKKEGCMLGDQQMQWLQEKLLASTANFKFIICGSQILSEDPMGENFAKHPFERQLFLDFLSQNKIKGVIFLSGDRHFTELSCLKRPGAYPLYEYTCSPMTSFVDPFYSKTNPIRVDSTFVRTQNFGKISLLGQGAERRCRIETYSPQNKLFWVKELYLKDLQ